jgi:hypothetical protein
MDEVFESATLIQTGKIRDFPLVLMGREFWRPLIDFFDSRLLAEKTIDQADLERLVVTDSTEEAVELIREAALRRFGLSYERPVRKWWLLERAPAPPTTPR